MERLFHPMIHSYNLFYKNLNDLSIKIKDNNVSLTNTASKQCINNKYIPIDIFDLNHKFYNLTFIDKIKNTLRNLINIKRIHP